jgi:hypothetical protein
MVGLVALQLWRRKHTLRDLIHGADPPDQLQPPSLDLRLGSPIHRVRASFLPGATATVEDNIAALAMHEFALDHAGAVLEKGCVDIVPLLESLALREAHLRHRQSQELDRPDRRVHPPHYRLRKAEYSTHHVISYPVKHGDNLSASQKLRG